MAPTCETLPLGAAGLGDASLLAGFDNPERSPKPHKNQASSDRARRLQLLARRLHRLGPKPLFHFLDEVSRGANLRARLEAYAELDANFVREFSGDRFAAPFIVDGGRL